MFALPRHIGLKQAVIAFSAALILAFGGILTQSSYRTYRQIIADAATSAESIARSAETNTGRTILSIDAMLMGINQALDTAYRNVPIGGSDVRAMLRRMNEQTLSVRDVMIIDENGRGVNGGSSTFSPSRSYVDRSYSKAQRDELPSLFISRPERSRLTGSWSVFMSRPLTLASGFRGIIVAEVPIQTFGEFFASIASPSGLRITLMFEDGFRDSAGLAVAYPQKISDVSIVQAECYGSFQMDGGRSIVFLLKQRQTQLALSRGIIGLDGNRFLV